MGYQTIDIHPLSGAMGAEISGLDLVKDVSNQQFDEIHQAFLDYQAIFFRDQTLTPNEQASFARRFGSLAQYPFVEGLPDAPEIFEILKTEDQRMNFGGTWHSDSSFMEAPPKATMLYCLESPPAGGDTLFANTYLAYDTLSDRMKQMIDGLIGVNTSELPGGRRRRFKDHSAMKIEDETGAEDTFTGEHPIVRTHGETGRKALYLNRVHTKYFKGMTKEESQPLIQYLCDHATRPEFTCRFSWTPNTLGLWDNRCTQHYALNDYQGHRRRMHRVTINGERPQ